MHFHPVWYTSPAHLERFRRTIAGATPEARQRVRYDVPPDCPSAALLWGLTGMRAPLLFEAAGTFEAGADALTFVPGGSRIFGSRVAGLRRDVGFSIPLGRVVSAERYVFRSPVAAQWDVTWLHLRCATEGPAADCLLTIGATLWTLRSAPAKRERFLAHVEASVGRQGWAGRHLGQTDRR